MQKFDSRVLGVEQGDTEVFSDWENNGEMWTGEGQRSKRVYVKFSEKYLSRPAVQVQFKMWDMDQRFNQRAEISAENVSNEGFEIVFTTWGDSKVARVSASWTALGQTVYEDDFAL